MTADLRRFAVGATVATVALSPLLAGTGASAAPARPAPAHVTIVHGLRGLVASVSVDGKRVLTSFAPKRSANLTLRPGRHRVVVRRQGDKRTVLATTITVRSGENLTAALGLSDAGRPKLYEYDDALRSASSSPSTLVFRDIADAGNLAPAVDGRHSGRLSDGTQVVRSLRAGSHSVSVARHGTNRTVVPPRRVPVATGDATALYLIGSAQQKDLTWVATRIRPADATPSSVITGNSGLAAPAAFPWWAAGLVGAGLLGGAASMRRRRVRG